MYTPQEIKDILNDKISLFSRYSWMYVNDPKKDFTRNRKLNFETMLHMIISMEGQSVNQELLKYFSYSGKIPSASAFNQQRQKIRIEAFEHLLTLFNNEIPFSNNYDGYRLLACDGSDINIATNSKDTDNYQPNPSGNGGFNQLHINAMYDICNRIYTDTIIESHHNYNEGKAMCSMVDRYDSDQKTIFIADRNYAQYNVFAHIQEKGQYFLIRAKNLKAESKCTLFSDLSYPDTDEFDVTKNLLLTRKSSKNIKANPEIYRHVTKKFDYTDNWTLFYPLNIRIVSISIGNGKIEYLITNLPEKEFPPNRLKELYKLRWTIIPISALLSI